VKASILRVRDKGERWVVSDGAHTLRAGTSATLKSVVRRWEAVHGRPADGYSRVPGILERHQAEAFLEQLEARRV